MLYATLHEPWKPTVCLRGPEPRFGKGGRSTDADFGRGECTGVTPRGSVAASLFEGPPAVLMDHDVDFSREADSFIQRNYGFLVMLDVIPGEFAAFAVFGPPFLDPIATDMELPHLARHALEVLNAIDADAVTAVDLGNPPARIVPLFGKGGHQLLEPW